jgi:hypothetical protein
MPIRRVQPAVEGRRAGTILCMQARSRTVAVRLSSDGMFQNQDEVGSASGPGKRSVRILPVTCPTLGNVYCWFALILTCLSLK